MFRNVQAFPASDDPRFIVKPASIHFVLNLIVQLEISVVLSTHCEWEAKGSLAAILILTALGFRKKIFSLWFTNDEILQVSHMLTVLHYQHSYITQNPILPMIPCCLSVPPVITTLPSSDTHSYALDFAFKCDAKGKPTPTLRWLKDGKELENGSRIWVRGTEFCLSLAISIICDFQNNTFSS